MAKWSGHFTAFNSVKISGLQNIDTPCGALWHLVFEPSALLQIVPGCYQVEKIAPGQYRANLTLKVPSLAGSYEIFLQVVENQAPRFCRLAGNAHGPAGEVHGQGTFVLMPEGQRTIIAYDGEAQLSGSVGGLQPRIVEEVAQMLIRHGLNRLAELAHEHQPSLS